MLVVNRVLALITFGAQRGARTHDPEIKSLMLYRPTQAPAPEEPVQAPATEPVLPPIPLDPVLPDPHDPQGLAPVRIQPPRGCRLPRGTYADMVTRYDQL